VYATENKSRVKITAYKGTLKLRWTLAGKRFSLTDRLKDSPQGWKAAEKVANQIELDILSDNFDPTLQKYKSNSKLRVVIESTKKAPTIQELWKVYVEFRSKTVKESTLYKQYSSITNYLATLPHKSLEDHIKIRNQIWKDKTPNGAKRLLTQLSAMCNWAVNSQLISENPFDGMAQDIKLSKSDNSDEMKVDPFTAQERDRIIAAFASSNYYSHYTPFIQFLFFTGCRPSEAVALKWGKVGSKILRFDAALVSGMGKGSARKGLKTQGHRDFPISDQLKAILETVRPSFSDPEALVFPSPKGTYIDFHNFRNRAWKRILEGLDIQYRKPYQTRHTFITLCLEAGVDAKDIAKWVGNSPEMIYKHYAGNRKNLEVPNL
jgi:integrase